MGHAPTRPSGASRPRRSPTFGIGYSPGICRFPAAAAEPGSRPEPRDPARGRARHPRRRRHGARPLPGRLIFPIHDLQGHGIGFGARILPSDPRAGEQAKYLNTAETPDLQEARGALQPAPRPHGDREERRGLRGRGLYRRHRVLAGGHRADASRPAARRWGKATSASSRGSLPRAIMAFDSDEAGARAAERAAEFQERFPSVETVVMIMPDGLDPAEFVAAHGADGVREAARGARPLVEYMVRRTIGRHDLSTVEGQSRAVADAMPIIDRLTDPVRRSEYAHLVADLAGVTEFSVVQAIDARRRGPPVRRGRRVARRMSAARQGRARDAEAARARPLPSTTSTPASSPTTTSAAPRPRKALAALREAGGEATVVGGGDDEKLGAMLSCARGRAARRRGRPRLRLLGLVARCRSSC